MLEAHVTFGATSDGDDPNTDPRTKADAVAATALPPRLSYLGTSTYPSDVQVPSDAYDSICAATGEPMHSARTELQAAPTPSQIRSGAVHSERVVAMDLTPAGTPRSASSANTLLFLAGVVAAPTPS